MGNISLNTQIRYAVEHKLLPQLLFSKEGKKTLTNLQEKLQAEYIVGLFNAAGNSRGYSCPYKKSDFKFIPHYYNSFAGLPNLVILEIAMPEPDMPPLCSRIYICHDGKMNNIRYFTLEKSMNDKEALCGWDSSGNHLNYDFNPSSKEESLKKVIELYTGNSAPSLVSEVSRGSIVTRVGSTAAEKTAGSNSCSLNEDPDTKHCPECGRSIPIKARFCSYCGKKLAGICPNCGFPLIGGERFCRKCGSKLPADDNSKSGIPQKTVDNKPNTGAGAPAKSNNAASASTPQNASSIAPASKPSAPPVKEKRDRSKRVEELAAQWFEEDK